MCAFVAAVLAACLWSADAQAGYAIQPATGTTTTPEPTFLVFLDKFDSLATVYVSTSPQMSSSGSPVQRLGSCSPTTPFGEPNKYTCRPSSYSSDFSSRLAPGTYYWWITFWRSDPSEGGSGMRVSGPFQFMVAAPTAPAAAALVAPADGARVGNPVTLSVRAPAGAAVRLHASTDADTMNDGSPLGLDYADCSGNMAAEGVFTCDLDESSVYEGETYYWWAVISVAGGSWIYGPRTVSITRAPATGSAGGGTQPSAPAATRTRDAAPYLPTVTRWRGASAKHARLSAAAYQYSKWLGYPRQVAVGCWSDRDWPSVSDRVDHHNLLGFWSPYQPRWLHLAPRVCRAMQTLMTSRPRYPNIIIANALDTVAHEMLHAMGIRDEAKTECFSMQTADVVGYYLGVRGEYLKGLSRLFLAANKHQPPQYRDPWRCREGGVWDLDPDHPSAPWHP